MIILGIDPGLANTGYGIIETSKKRRGSENRLKCIGYGCIETSPELNEGQRLKKINQKLNKLIRECRPEALAIENVYFFKNLKTALPVSQAKGVILLTAAQKNIPTQEFTPLQVKMATVGYGRAEKQQVQKMVKILLDLEEIPRPDHAADALATAICFAIFQGKKR